MKIGFCGIGRMGAAMVARLIDQGEHPVIWNRSAEKAKPLIDKGAAWAASPAECRGAKRHRPHHPDRRGGGARDLSGAARTFERRCCRQAFRRDEHSVARFAAGTRQGAKASVRASSNVRSAARSARRATASCSAWRAARLSISPRAKPVLDLVCRGSIIWVPTAPGRR